MSTSVKDLYVRTLSEHQYFGPASAKELESIARYGLPEDLMDFYRLSNGALLHRMPSDYGNFEYNGISWKWSIASIGELQAINEKGYIAVDSPLWQAARRWFGVVDVMDGNWLAINANPGGLGEVINCYHETVGDPGRNVVIARSFTELFERLISTPEAFWLGRDKQIFGRY